MYLPTELAAPRQQTLVVTTVEYRHAMQSTQSGLAWHGMAWQVTCQILWLALTLQLVPVQLSLSSDDWRVVNATA